jgi:hypothetical protein
VGRVLEADLKLFEHLPGAIEANNAQNDKRSYSFDASVSKLSTRDDSSAT